MFRDATFQSLVCIVGSVLFTAFVIVVAGYAQTKRPTAATDNRFFDDWWL